MAFTTGNDLNILQSSDTANMGAGAGDDVYLINASSMSAGQSVTITDTEGSNIIKIVGGVTLASSIVGANVIQLTLSSGAVINLLGADTMSYEIGGDAFSTGTGTSQTFSDFVTQTLGTSVPSDSSTSAGNSNVQTNTDGTVTGGGSTTSTDDGTDTTTTVTFSLSNSEIELMGINTSNQNTALDVAL